MNSTKNLNRRKAQRIRRVRALISGTAERPRLVVNRTNRNFSAQLIDDVKQHTILSVSNLSGKKAVGVSKAAGAKNEKTAQGTTKSGLAFTMGEQLAKKAVEKGIVKVVFDRRSYQFHGRVKNFAEGAKKGGLSF